MRSPRMLLVGAFALSAALSLSACGDLFSPSGPASDLSKNREKWNSHAHRAYSFTVQHACFCAINGPVRVTVVDDSVVAAYELPGATPIDTRNVESIDALFTFIDRAIAGSAATLEVSYDPVLGYPIRIVYDGSVNIADDETTITVSNVLLPSNLPN